MKIPLKPLLLSFALSAFYCAASVQPMKTSGHLAQGGLSVKTKVVNDDNAQYALELEKLLSKLNHISGVPGFSVSIVKGGEEIASVATGFSNVNDHLSSQPETIFRLASVSKIIGATMLADLVNKGLLDPDKAIHHYLPRLPKHYQNLTVRQLVSHTSGMPHYQAKDYDIYDRHYDSAQQAVSTLKARDLNAPPGQAYLYSTHGYTLAGAVFEAVQKQTIETALPQFLKRWTGNATPMVEDITNLASNSSQLYRLTNKSIVQEAFGEKSYSVFGAGLSATARDLARFGDRVLTRSKQDKAFADLLFTPTEFTTGQAVKRRNFSVGFGWRIGQDELGRTVYHHAGATPGARSILMLYPEQALSIAILSNASWVSSIDHMAFALANLYIDQAKPKNMPLMSKYTAQFDQDEVSGSFTCEGNACSINNETSDYSDWLNAFNQKGIKHKHWPVFAYDTTMGERLLMVTKTGIRSLHQQSDTFYTQLNKDKSYQLQISTSQPLKH